MCKTRDSFKGCVAYIQNPRKTSCTAYCLVDNYQVFLESLAVPAKKKKTNQSCKHTQVGILYQCILSFAAHVYFHKLLYVQSVVDAVNDIVGGGFLGHKTVLVLFDNFLFL